MDDLGHERQNREGRGRCRARGRNRHACRKRCARPCAGGWRSIPCRDTLQTSPTSNWDSSPDSQSKPVTQKCYSAQAPAVTHRETHCATLFPACAFSFRNTLLTSCAESALALCVALV